MTPITRRALRGAVALAAPMIARPARAAPIVWRLGHVAPTDTPLHKSLLDAADSIAKRSGGAMRLDIIGEGRAGIPSGLLAQVKSGGIEMTVASNTQLAPTLPNCGIPAIGFLFADYPNPWSIMDGPLGQLIRAPIAKQFGLEVMDKIWDFGFRHITTTDRTIRTAADLSGLRIRAQIDAEEMELFRSMGASPVVITLPYLKMALEHHQAEGQEGLLQVVRYAHLNEVQTRCAMTRHIWDGMWICANGAAWKGLPERLRNIVANTMNSAAARQRELNAALEQTTREDLARTGMEFNDIDRQSFRTVLRTNGYYGRLRTKLGDITWTAIQDAAGKLE